MEQRGVIKFYCELGKTATELYKEMQKVYGDDCLSCAQEFHWFSTFKEGREYLEDESCSGHSVSARTL
jgi:hypothetical protein